MSAPAAKPAVVTYQAFNGHKMQYWEDPARPGKPKRESAWDAWCAPDCESCCEGIPLPDY